MPAFRILYVRDDATTPETINAGFDSLEQAMDVFAARGLRILYIAERRPDARRLDGIVGRAARKAEAVPHRRSSFPIRRFSARALA
jgi:hypothetical protein